MQRTITRIGDSLAWVEQALLKVSTVALAAVVVIQVFSRNLGYLVSWANDVALLLFTWSVFLGGALAVRKGAHYVVDIMGSQRVSLRLFIQWVAALAMAVFMIVVIWEGSRMAWLVRGRISGAGQINMMYYFLSLPVSFVLSLFHLIEVTFRDWEEFKNRDR